VQIWFVVSRSAGVDVLQHGCDAALPPACIISSSLLLHPAGGDVIDGRASGLQLPAE
jgi:hypothetical protein